MGHQSDSESAPDALRAQAHKAYRELSKLQECAFRECCAGPSGSTTENVSITWSQALTSDEFAENVFARYKEVTSEVAVIKSGRVYCYHCASSVCEHSLPTEDGHAFAGYQDTGRPRWVEFLNFLLSTGDNRVDELFIESPKILASVSRRKALIADQLTTYGRRSLTYRIIGQVVVGYVRIKNLRFAISFQVVETSGHKLISQTITSERVHDVLVDASKRESSSLHRILDATNGASGQIRRLNDDWASSNGKKKERKQLTDKVLTILRHLATSIERKGRQYYRRTVHAEERADQRRPVHTALKDVGTAKSGDFFLDETRQSIIVLGRNRRSHVFNSTGVHITTLILSGDKIELRQRRKRYVPLTDTQRKDFLSAVASRGFVET